MRQTKCDVCGDGVLRKKAMKNYAYKTAMGPIKIEGESLFDECTVCDDTFIPGKLLDAWNRQLLECLLEKKGYFTAEELRFIFAVLPHSQSELADAAGRDRSTLTKYKTGENPIDPLFDELLRLVIADELRGKADTIERLRGRKRLPGKEAPIRKVSAAG